MRYGERSDPVLPGVYELNQPGRYRSPYRIGYRSHSPENSYKS